MEKKFKMSNNFKMMVMTKTKRKMNMKHKTIPNNLKSKMSMKNNPNKKGPKEEEREKIDFDDNNH